MTDSNDALFLVFARNAFYKRLHFLALAAFLLSLIVVGVLIGVFIFLANNSAKPLYFATDKVGRLITIVPVNQPNMTNSEVASWAVEAVQSAFSYDFVNYRTELQSAEKYFTTYGWSNYMKSLAASNNLLALTERKMIVITQVIESPKLLTSGLLGGAYAWKFQFSLLVTYWYPPYDDKSKFVNPLQATAIVQRQPILQSDNGLGIIQVIASLPSTNQSQGLSGAPPG